MFAGSFTSCLSKEEKQRNKDVSFMNNLSKAKIIASSFLAIIILTLAGGYAYLKYIEGKLGRRILPELTANVAGEPVNILLLGSDSRGEKNARSDTIIFLRYDPKKERAYLVSIPRDSRVNIEGYGYRKINSATALEGPNLMVKTVKKLSGMDLHHFILIDFSGFKNLVDALGGIRIYVSREINSTEPGFKMKVSKGWHEMNGSQALNYVRFRHDPRGDIGRIERQQNFFKALSAKLFSFGSLPRAPYIINALADNVETDMSGGELLGYARSIKAIDDKNIMMTTAPGTPDYIDGTSYVILDEEETDQLFDDIKAGRRIKTIKQAF